MSIDIKAKIEELAAKLQKDPALLQRFQSDPVKTLEQLAGVDLPDEQLQPLVAGVKARLAASGLGDKLGGLKTLREASRSVLPSLLSGDGLVHRPADLAADGVNAILVLPAVGPHGQHHHAVPGVRVIAE